MATKTTKKSTAKPVAAKKTVTKKTTAKKTTRATAAKPAKKIEMMATASMPMEHNCPCGNDCHCGGECKCHCHGVKHFVKKLIVALILLALGFAAAKVCCCGKGLHVKFAQNGCMIEESVKCPKLREMLPAMDINQDGCITRAEYREIKRQLRSQPAAVVETADVTDVVEDVADVEIAE